MYGTSVNAQSLSLSLASSNYNGYNISCFGGRDGSINLTVTGGTAPYTFIWSNGSTTEDLSAIPAGYYHVIVTDRDSTMIEGAITLTEPERIVVDYLVSSYPNGYNVSCYSCYNGSILLLPGGGVSPYNFTWEDGPTIQDRFNLGSGNYRVYITDANLCELSPETFYLTEPERSDWTMNGNTGSNPTTHFIGSTDNKDVVFKTNNTERLRILGNGSIKLNGFSGSGNRALFADNNGIINAAPCYLWEQCGNTITSTNFLGTNNAIDLKFKVNAPAYPVPVMTLKVGGNVGIGTETPVEKLEIHHHTAIGTAGGINLVNTQFGNNSSEIKFSSMLSLNPLWAIGNDIAHNGGQNFFIYDHTANTGSGKTRLLIDQSGRVGIDTESPSEKLEIAHNDAGGGIAINRINTSNIAKSELKFLHNGVPQFAFGTDLGNDGGHNLFVWDHLAASGAGASRFIITDQGYIGIGTVNPSEKLNIVGGNIYLQGETQGLIVDDQTNKRIGLIKYPGREAGIWRTVNQRFEIGRVNTTSLPGNPSTGDFTTDVYIDGNGKVGIGVIPSPNSLYRLFVEDGIVTRDVLVTNVQTFPDFVFEEGYELRTLYELEAFIEKNRHLPDFPSADEVNKSEGFAVGRMQVELLKTVEELSLYVIALKKEIDALKANNIEIDK